MDSRQAISRPRQVAQANCIRSLVQHDTRAPWRRYFLLRSQSIGAVRSVSKVRNGPSLVAQSPFYRRNPAMVAAVAGCNNFTRHCAPGVGRA